MYVASTIGQVVTVLLANTRVFAQVHFHMV